METVSDVDLAYLAGAIDSDGSIQVMRNRGDVRKTDGVRPNYYAVRVTVVQVDRRLPDYFMARFGGTVYHYESSTGHRSWYVWTVAGQHAANVLRQVRRFLVLKNKQADSAITLADLITSQRKMRRGGELLGREEEAVRERLLQEVRRHNARRGREMPN